MPTNSRASYGDFLEDMPARSYIKDINNDFDKFSRKLDLDKWGR
jgi:hypothetical protein